MAYYYLAKRECSRQAVTALEGLILDWPFGFIHIPGGLTEEIEANKSKWGVNMSARAERLRDFVRLSNANFLRIVARAADLVQRQAVGGKKASPDMVQQWLQQHVKWGLLHCPDVRNVRNVKRHMDNWAALQGRPRAQELIEAALMRWGLAAWKLGIIVQKPTNDRWATAWKPCTRGCGGWGTRTRALTAEWPT